MANGRDGTIIDWFINRIKDSKDNSNKEAESFQKREDSKKTTRPGRRYM